ncbi:hypothetical protein [Persephonella sp.]
MITRNYKDIKPEEFVKRFESRLKNAGFHLHEKKETVGSLPLPKIYVYTLSKDNNSFRISIVCDKNGITATAVGVKDKDLKTELTDFLNSLLL